MSKTLLICRSIYPMPSGSAVVVKQLASQFSKDQMVIVGEKVNYKNETTWGDELPTIHRIKLKNARLPKVGKFLKFVYIKRAVTEIKKIYNSNNCTSIVCVYPDEFFLFAGYLASKSLKAPFYSWFHNSFVDNRQGIMKLFGKWLQKKVFEHSKKIFTISDGLSEFLKEKYPSYNFYTLKHGFKIPKSNHEPFIPRQDGKLNFAYTGSLNESCREASVRLCKAIISNHDYTLNIYTGFNQDLFRKYGIEGENVKHHGFISQKEFERELAKNDILLLPHGFDGARTDAEYKTIFPTRTITLLYSDKPILCHSPKGTFITKFIEDNNCATLVTNKSEEEIKGAIENIISDINATNQKIVNSIKASKQFDVVETAKYLKSELKNDIEN